jgi:hypothetical protein
VKDAGPMNDQQQNKRQTVFVVETLYLFFSMLSAKQNSFLLIDNHLFNKTSFKHRSKSINLKVTKSNSVAYTKASIPFFPDNFSLFYIPFFQLSILYHADLSYPLLDPLRSCPRCIYSTTVWNTGCSLPL